MEQTAPECNDTLTKSLSKTVLNSLSAQIAILDANGVILETNRSWMAFAAQNGATGIDFTGMNYLDICDAATGPEARFAHTAAEGIRAVIQGVKQEFLFDYPCHSPQARRWFYMRVARLDAPSRPAMVVVSHEDITQLKIAEETLKNNKKKLEDQKRELEEANIALRVILKQRENDRTEIETRFLNNIRDLVLPFLEKVKSTPLRAKDKKALEMLEDQLKEIMSPLLQRLASLQIILTPQEIQVAAMVKSGKSSKEIAEMLNLSETTVHFHRKNLRKKLGLEERSVNLRSHLLSLS